MKSIKSADEDSLASVFMRVLLINQIYPPMLMDCSSIPLNPKHICPILPLMLLGSHPVAQSSTHFVTGF
jgi:hypothetical protein